MSEQTLPIDEAADASLAVAPPDPAQDGDTAAAGTSGDPHRDDDAIDIGSEDSMDASDPPSTSAPGSHRDAEQADEESRQQDA